MLSVAVKVVATVRLLDVVGMAKVVTSGLVTSGRVIVVVAVAFSEMFPAASLVQA